MEHFINFTNQSQGRDRIFRATQYACALLKYLIRNKAARAELARKLDNLEKNMSAGRKLFRLGNTVSSVHAARRTLQLSDPVLRACLAAAHLSRALYFICDNLLWARSLGFLQHLDKERWGLLASRFYLVSLLLNLARDLYQISRIMGRRARDKQVQEKISRHLGSNGDVACMVVPKLDAFLLLLCESLRSHPPLLLDTVKNVCDLFIPMDSLRIYKTNPGVVGFCGLASSVLGILSVLQPSLKVKP
ncbi:peroxisomal membrane protein 11A [Lepisosteus oculatus]|uniref:Peroxisomal biogenesis factor 11 alpha n=1 Tax=Lepisosteus oculatus TaxID=7918 RepID=W5NAN2_LEPOC|nr:PREDICTED: peroxisomal membrane protein 11A [Lepisosteus oculatus]